MIYCTVYHSVELIFNYLLRTVPRENSQEAETRVGIKIEKWLWAVYKDSKQQFNHFFEKRGLRYFCWLVVGVGNMVSADTFCRYLVKLPIPLEYFFKLNEQEAGMMKSGRVAVHIFLVLKHATGPHIGSLGIPRKITSVCGYISALWKSSHPTWGTWTVC